MKPRRPQGQGSEGNKGRRGEKKDTILVLAKVTSASLTMPQPIRQQNSAPLLPRIFLTISNFYPALRPFLSEDSYQTNVTPPQIFAHSCHDHLPPYRSIAALYVSSYELQCFL